MAVNHSETDAVERSVARTANRCAPGQACATGYSVGTKPIYGFFCNNFQLLWAAQPRHECGGCEVGLHVFDRAGMVASRSQG